MSVRPLTPLTQGTQGTQESKNSELSMRTTDEISTANDKIHQKKGKLQDMSHNIPRAITSSFLGGFFQKLLTAPISLLKQRSQVHTLNTFELLRVMKEKETVLEDSNKGGIMKYRMWLRALWKGNSLSILKSALYTTCQQPLYLYLINSSLRTQQQKILSSFFYCNTGFSFTTSNKLGKGVSIGFLSWFSATVATTAVYPIELIRTRYANHIERFATHYSGGIKPPRHALSKVLQQMHTESTQVSSVFKKSSIWFRGIGATIISTSPFNVLNGTLLFLFREEYGWNMALAGGMAAGISSFVTHPLDTVTQNIKMRKKLSEPISFRKMVHYMIHTQGYKESDLRPQYLFDSRGYVQYQSFGSTSVTLGSQIASTPSVGPVCNLNEALQSTIRRESSSQRLFKTFFAGIGPNLVKSSGTYAFRWFFTDVIYSHMSR
jgi:Mitochondrial carrier protein